MSTEDNISSKRTRASGEVLDYLLQEFENNQNPSPEQRRDISDKTNMSEKAVRIWFQNRRAKIRKFERMGKGNGTPSSITSTMPIENHGRPSRSSRSRGSSIPIDINEKYCFIDCSSLSVGSWQRIKSGKHNQLLLKTELVNLSPYTINNIMSDVDLLIILSKKNMEINYFFSATNNESKILFRIFYPISTIVTCSLVDNNFNRENEELRLTLSHQPKFAVFFFNGVSSETNQWSFCDDFSENQQVSLAHTSEGREPMPHVLVGFKNSLQFFNSFILDNNSAPTTDYHPHVQLADPGTVMDFNHDLNMWSDNKAREEAMDQAKIGTNSPLAAQFDSDTSPISVESSGSGNRTSLIGNEDLAKKHYGEVFTVETPEFFPSAHAPGSSLQAASNQDEIIYSPSTNLQSYTHSAYSPFNHLQSELEVEANHSPDSTYYQLASGTVVNSNSVENSNNSSSSANNNQVDNFIDYGNQDS